MAESYRAAHVVEEKTVPAVAETAVVRKEQGATETVRLHKRVHEDEEAVDIPIQAETIEVERTAVDDWVDGPIPVRQEGDTTIYPVMREVLVIEKRLKLVEEVRASRASRRPITSRNGSGCVVRRSRWSAMENPQGPEAIRTPD